MTTSQEVHEESEQAFLERMIKVELEEIVSLITFEIPQFELELKSEVEEDSGFLESKHEYVERNYESDNLEDYMPLKKQRNH